MVGITRNYIYLSLVSAYKMIGERIAIGIFCRKIIMKGLACAKNERILFF